MAAHYSESAIQGGGCSRSPMGIGDDPSLANGLNSPAAHYHRHMAVNTSTGPAFSGRVRITNRLGATGYIPEYETSANMIRIAIARRDRYQYQTTVNLGAMSAGYTLSNLSIRFANINQQWQRDRHAYRFTRGVIFLDLDITVYVTDEARDKPRCRDLIMRHEMMHVDHERTIVTRTLPDLLPTLPYVYSDFTSPIPARDFDRRIRGNGDGHESELEQVIQRNVGVGLSSNMANALHRDHPEHGEEIRRCLRH